MGKKKNKKPYSSNNYKKMSEEDFDNMPKIRMDDNRLNDYKTLDTSFLEGRFNKVKIKKTKHKKLDNDIEILDEEVPEKSGFCFEIIGSILIVLVVGFLFFFIGISCFNLYLKGKDADSNVKEKINIDNNYLFLGDSITEYYDLGKYFVDLPVVNSGVAGDTTNNLLNNMNVRVHNYNPSKIFILIGTNDLYNGASEDEVVNNIKKIINDIQKYRPFCKIYIESIYPVNGTKHKKIDDDVVTDSRNNDIIKNVNAKIENLAKKEKINYINMYDKLIDEADNLDIDYTKDGLHLSDKGYRVVTDELIKYVKE